MAFNKNKYINDYNKTKYKMFPFRVKKDDQKIINKLTSVSSMNSYINDLINKDINKESLDTINSRSIKNKKGLIVTNAFSYRDSAKHQCESIINEFKLLGIEVIHVTNKEVLACIKNSTISLKYSPSEYDFVIYLDKDKYVASMLERLGFRLFNSANSIELCDDKMLTHIHLANNNIKMPDTYSYPLNYENHNDESYLDEILNNLEYPFIIKENFGSLGNQIYLINNKEELIQKEKELKYKPHIYQEFIKEASGVDYRLFLIGGKVIASMKRVNKTSFKANIAQGGTGFYFNPSKEMIEISCKTSIFLDLDYCAIDFVVNKNNEPILIEVNSNAYFKEIEKVTNVNVAKIYAKYIYSKIYEIVVKN